MITVVPNEFVIILNNTNNSHVIGHRSDGSVEVVEVNIELFVDVYVSKIKLTICISWWECLTSWKRRQLVYSMPQRQAN